MRERITEYQSILASEKKLRGVIASTRGITGRTTTDDDAQNQEH